MATPKKPPEWLLFGIAIPFDLSVRPPVLDWQPSLPAATWAAAAVVATYETSGEPATVGILCPDGAVERVGSGCHLLPIGLRGELDKSGHIVLRLT